MNDKIKKKSLEDYFEKIRLENRIRNIKEIFKLPLDKKFLERYQELFLMSLEPEMEIALLKDQIDKEKEKMKKQLWKRIYVRSVYMNFDTFSQILKQSAILHHNHFKLSSQKISRADHAIINEESYYLTDSGEVKVRDNYLETKKSFRFAIKISAKLLNIDFDFDVKGKGWESYLKGLKIRNRLTHPKKWLDLYVSAEDMKIVDDALSWFRENARRLSTEIKLQMTNLSRTIH